MKNMLQITLSTVLTSVIYLLGGFDIALRALLIMMILDYITGVTSAIVQRKLSSKIGYKGFLKKFGYLIIVVMAVVMDQLTKQDGTIRTMVIYFFVANDGISILENCGKIGIPLPKKLKDALIQLKGDEAKMMEEKEIVVEQIEENVAVAPINEVSETVEEPKYDELFEKSSIETQTQNVEILDENIETIPEEVPQVIFTETELHEIVNENPELNETICLQTITSVTEDKDLG